MPAVPDDLVPDGNLHQLPPLPSDLEPPVRVSDEQHQQYEEFGFTLLPELIDRQTIAELQESVDAMVEHRIGNFSFEPSDPTKIQRIGTPNQYSRAFQRLMRNPALCGAVAQLIGPSFRHNNVKLNFKPAGIGSAVEWHQVCALLPRRQGAKAQGLRPCPLVSPP